MNKCPQCSNVSDQAGNCPGCNVPMQEQNEAPTVTPSVSSPAPEAAPEETAPPVRETAPEAEAPASEQPSEENQG